MLERWKEYFQNLLSIPIVPERPQLISEGREDHEEPAPPTYNEICSIINKLKTNKAAGPDNIKGAAFNVTHFELAILLVWVVRGVADNGGWVPCGLGFSEQWNVGPCSSAYFVWNSSC